MLPITYLNSIMIDYEKTVLWYSHFTTTSRYEGTPQDIRENDSGPRNPSQNNRQREVRTGLICVAEETQQIKIKAKELQIELMEELCD